MHLICWLQQSYRRCGETERPLRCLWKLGARGFTSRPCKWYYVELIDGEWDDEENEAVVETSGTLRATAGEAVPREGVWYTPALKGEAGALHLKAGDRLPATRFTDWGEVIWYWQPERQR